MSELCVLMDIGPPGGSIGAIAGIAFFLILIAVAFIAFRLLKKTVGLVLRVFVVLVILAIAFFGTAAWFVIGTGGSKPRPNPTRSH
jgi:apolipoprotein N-acyltransferase